MVLFAKELAVVDVSLGAIIAVLVNVKGVFFSDTFSFCSNQSTIQMCTILKNDRAIITGGTI